MQAQFSRSMAFGVFGAVIVIVQGCSSIARPGGPGSSAPSASNTSSPTAPADRAGASSSQGLVKEYDVTPEAAWEIAKTVLRWEGAGAIEEKRSQNYMLTSVGANAVSSGTVMGAWVEPGKQPQTSKVTILTKQRFLSSASGTSSEAMFHKRFAQALGFIKQGKVLPKVPPALPA